MPTPVMTTDVLVIGAGPVGLFQAFQLGLLGMSVEVVDALPQPGGQCLALYPDKPIYDIPGVPRCTGRELTAQLLRQCEPFLPLDASTGQHQHVHLGHVIDSLQTDSSTGRFLLSSTQGASWSAKAVILAGGVGAFQPRDWSIPDAPANASFSNVHYDLPAANASSNSTLAGQHIAVIGGTDEALETVLTLAKMPAAQAPASITLLHRRDQFQASPPLDAQVREYMQQGLIHLCVGVAKSANCSDDTLQSITLTGADSTDTTLALDQLFIRLGLSPKLGAISDWGLAMSRKQISVDSASCVTSVDGIYAVGDMATYTGKQRLILCGFHEATLAAHACLAKLYPEQQGPLQYTTTSALLQQRLGVAKN